MLGACTKSDVAVVLTGQRSHQQQLSNFAVRAVVGYGIFNRQGAYQLKQAFDCIYFIFVYNERKEKRDGNENELASATLNMGLARIVEF